MAMKEIPVDIITGMKGAGKTTLINALLEGVYRDSRVTVFTNEIGDVPYGEACRVHPVLGGCICCTAQAELIAGIRRVLQEEEPERIVIEMSGKGAIQDLLQIFAYLPSCALHQLIYVLDIRKWRALAAVLGDFPQQIRSAPILLFSRWKEVSPELRTASAAQMRQGNIPVPERGAPKPGKRRRPRDEVAELSENYDEMLRTVGEQFTRIGEDRVRILRLLDSRQAFYNNVTHELKTPLTTIQGYAQLLSQAGPEEKELVEEGLTHNTHESARRHRMVIQLLEMGDSERGRAREPMDAAATLRSVAESMNLRAARYGCAIRFDGEEKLPILGREERVREVCINLLDNALKYGEAGEVIWALAERSGGYAALRVVNRGRGFSDAEAEKLFEPFYRADKTKSREMGSAGLGLPLCKKIVEEHGGRMRARCRGGYTLFEALFPLREGGEEG